MKNGSLDWEWRLRLAYQRTRDLIGRIILGTLDLLGIPWHLPYTCKGEAASELIFRKLQAEGPCFIGRTGATGLRYIESCLLKNKSFFHRLKCRLTGHTLRVPKPLISPGFVVPLNEEGIQRFADVMIPALSKLDVYASWRWEDLEVFHPPYPFDCVPLNVFEPFRFAHPWTKALEGRKVLVVNPFVESIRKQYEKRRLLFKNPDVLPDFTLINYCPFYDGIRDNPDPKSDWIDNLECMKKEIEDIDFDIALIGCGPYGFPLAAHIRDMGKKAVIMGGVLQLLFGIRGKRWDNLKEYKPFFNEYWIRPGQNERPTGFKKVEGGCYW